MGKKKKSPGGNTIAQNKKSRHDFVLEDKFEAGLALEGWEVKSLRAGKCQLVDAYVIMQNGEAYLVGCHITPLESASSHVHPAPARARKLLLNRRELAKIHQAIEAKGKTCVCTKLYWKKHLVKADIALATGKKTHDKRATEKERDWNREKQRVLRNTNK